MATRPRLPKPTALPWSLLVILLLSQGHIVTGAEKCPAECTCIGKFVSCYQFSASNLHYLPSDVETLVLNGANISRLASGFLQQFPHLQFLEIQSTRIERLTSGTLSGSSSLHQLALSDCHIGIIEADAVSDLTGVSDLTISGSHIGIISTGAFSSLSNVEEFSIWSTNIETVERGAIRDLRDTFAFKFYLNNVTTLDKDAFVNIGKIDKVDVYLNNFRNFHGAAVISLRASTGDMDFYSNTFLCQCDIILSFHEPILLPFLVSQKCTMPNTAQLVRLIDADIVPLCANQSATSLSPSPTSKPATTYTDDTATRSTQTATVITAKSTKHHRPTIRASVSHVSTAQPVISDVKTYTSMVKTTSSMSTASAKGQSGKLSEDSSYNAGQGAKEQSIVFLLLIVFVVGCLVI